MTSGRIAFLPWLTLPIPVKMDRFLFQPMPVSLEGTSLVYGADISQAVLGAISTHVDQNGQPVSHCTIVLMPEREKSWDISDDELSDVFQATELLALCCLSEQKFLLGHFAPHLNASMFRGVSMRVSAGSEEMAVRYARRGGALSVAGRKYSETLFQQPPQIEGTSCDVVNERLLAALATARSTQSDVWDRVADSLELFLLANSELPELELETCVTLSAYAFERLIRPPKTSARGLAEAFELVWTKTSAITMQLAKRTKPDARADWSAEQSGWTLHRKWMKELYEVRSAHAHRGQRDDFSVNWDTSKHVVIAAYVYPLLVKRLLAAVSMYELDDNEDVACSVLDELLDSDWGSGLEQPPEWPTILSNAQATRGIRRAIERAMQDHSM